MVDFDKQIGREEKKHIDDDEYYVNNLDFQNPRPYDPSEKRVIGHDFGKKEDRFKTDFRKEFDIQ